MKKILLSADGPISIYEVPDKIAKNLEKYCLKFCDWVHTNPSKKIIGGCVAFDETNFIEYLNNVVNPNYLEKSRFVKTLGYFDNDEDIPEKYRDLPYFNF